MQDKIKIMPADRPDVFAPVSLKNEHSLGRMLQEMDENMPHLFFSMIESGDDAWYFTASAQGHDFDDPDERPQAYATHALPMLATRAAAGPFAERTYLTTWFSVHYRMFDTEGRPSTPEDRIRQMRDMPDAKFDPELQSGALCIRISENGDFETFLWDMHTDDYGKTQMEKFAWKLNEGNILVDFDDVDGQVVQRHSEEHFVGGAMFFAMHQMFKTWKQLLSGMKEKYFESADLYLRSRNRGLYDRAAATFEEDDWQVTFAVVLAELLLFEFKIGESEMSKGLIDKASPLLEAMLMIEEIVEVEGEA